MKCCCKQMKHHIEGNLVGYDRKIRCFYIPIANIISHGISFCPWCATKLPSDLRKEWFKEIHALGIEDPWEEYSKIPKKFRTDEWWKKRGL